MLLQLQSATFKYGDVTIFDNISLQVDEGDNVGLVGANGTGKSTLLQCIVGDLSLFSGTITYKNGITIGYLKQSCDFTSTNTLFDEMMTVFAKQMTLLRQIDEVSSQMSSCPFDSDEYKQLSNKYNKLMVQADVSEAYQSELKVKTVLTGMGMMPFASRVVSTLSGGEKTKSALCKMLLQSPDLMILDEPTNHLDYKTLDWLETFLSTSKCTLIVVSHDRYFLDKLCSTIWDMQYQRVTEYKGNYTKYKQQKQQRQLVQQREYDKQQVEIAKLTDYVARNKVRASTANMAKSREKMLDRMVVVDAPKADEQPPRFCFDYTTQPSQFPLSVSNLTLAFDDNTLVSNANFVLQRGQKMALLGLNGTGKSTLIKRIASCNPQDLGKIVFGKNVRFGYYDQENLNLQGNLRVLDQLWFDNVKMSQTEVRSLLALVTLGADDVNKLVGDLSGGERAKLGLAMIMAKDCNLLLLDEPTNHLDLPSREALEQALATYDGTVLFVSHDRYFVNSVCSCVAELSDKQITVFDGNYDDFLNKKRATTVTPTAVAEQKPTQPSGYRNAKQRAEQTNNARKVKQLESEITQLEKEIDQLNAQLALPQVASDYAQVNEIMQKLQALNDQLSATLEQWESLQS